jgi:hypothetical protein
MRARDHSGTCWYGTLSFTGSSLQREALTGDVTASAGSNATTIGNNTVTYAKMQDVSATQRIIGRKTAGAGDPEECTLSDVLDFVGSAAQGDILVTIQVGAGTYTQPLVLKTYIGTGPIILLGDTTTKSNSETK